MGLVATITQMGYTLGLLFLVPLCDTLNRKRLVLILCALLVVSAALAALAPGMAVLMAASAGMGVAATITQMVVPMAADLAREGERGKAVGIAFSGVLCGILLARVVSGAVGQWLGWREAFWLACAFAVLLSALLAWRLPDLPSKSSLSYGRLLVSMPGPTTRAAQRWASSTNFCGRRAGHWRSLSPSGRVIISGQPFLISAMPAPGAAAVTRPAPARRAARAARCAAPPRPGAPPTTSTCP